MKTGQIGLGDRVKDAVTGFTGVITGIVKYITGCEQALVIPSVDKEGKLRDGQWFDADRLLIIKANALQIGVTAPGPDLAPPKK